jgi:hypothetical protein
LKAEPSGIDDWPGGDKPLAERAKEYFESCDEARLIAADISRAYDIVTAAVMV